jgi:hypothetical protein
MGADSLAKNTPNAPELSAQFVCPSPKVLNFNEKRLHWASVVADMYYYCIVSIFFRWLPAVAQGLKNIEL